MVEILAGGGFDNAVKELGIKAKRAFKGSSYEVWQLEEDEYKKLCGVEDNDWKVAWGWWRYASGTNIDDEPCAYLKIGKKTIRAWYSDWKLREFIDWCREDDEESEHDARDYYNEFFDQSFSGLCDYCIRMWGASLERNVTAITVGLAALNGMTLAELWNACGE